MKQFAAELESILEEFQCRVSMECPRIRDRLTGGGFTFTIPTKLIVLESSSVTNLEKAQDSISRLCYRIQDQLVMRRQHLDAVETYLVISHEDLFNNSASSLHLPLLGTTTGSHFNRAKITFTLDGQEHLVEIQLLKYIHFRKADVDLLVIYPSLDYIPSRGIAEFALRYGQSIIVDECNYCFSRNGKITFHDRGEFPVLSSGYLRCRGLLCAYTVKEPGLEEKLDGCLSKIFRTAKLSGAQSIAIPSIVHPDGSMSSKNWLKAMLRHLTASVQQGSTLKKVLVSPVRDSKYVNEDLESALSDFAVDASRAGIHMAYEVHDKPPQASLRRCRFPSSSIIYALSPQDLETAQARLRVFLQERIKARDVKCPGIDCALAAKLWNERGMDVKTVCRLQYRASSPTSLLVSGGQDHLDKTCEHLDEMLQELVSYVSTSGTNTILVNPFNSVRFRGHP